jgi:CDP-glycerol glycerophosphotransferase (TagB/SpsB family)
LTPADQVTPLVSRFVRRIGVIASYLAGHLVRRDPSVWVFGNVKGFRDNPRYLAEHVTHAHRKIDAWWIARTGPEARQARAAGLNVATRGQAVAGSLQRRAGVAFLSNGFQDLQAAHLGGAFVVDLRHGQGTKRILLESVEPRSLGAGPLRRAMRWLRRRYVRQRLAQIDMIVAPGEQEQAMYARAFGGSASRIRVLGTPRFDVILGGPAHDRVARGDIRQRQGLQRDDYVVLWLPTWREDDDTTWLPPLDAADVDREIGGTRIVLLLKPHPYSDAATSIERLPRHSRIRWMADDDEDVNCLLRVADALVTDYSSAAFDFALLDRPILFFAPDADAYRRRHGLLPTFERLMIENHHRTWQELLAALRDTAAGRTDRGRDTASRIRAMSRNVDAPGSSERIARAVAQAVGVRLEDAR